MKPVEEPFGGLGQLAAIIRCCRARRDRCAPRSNPKTAVLHPEQALNLMPLRRSKQAIGNCHLCGTVGPLTFEHIPPKAAFNDCRVLEADIYRLIGSNLIDELNGPKGKYNQNGAGGYTLCSSCNDNTGSWYGQSYIEFIKQGYSYLYNFKQDDRISVTFQIKPLKILKQIFIMFCSACPPDFAVKHPDLVRYLLNRESRDFDGSIKILISFYDLKNSHSLRQSGLQPV